MLPSASIVISVYQRATYLDQAIAAALNQSVKDLEVIVCEDGESPAVEQVVGRFSDPRLQFIRNKVPLGAAANKLNAWRRSRAPFIVNLDDDDLIDPQFLARLLPPLLEQPEVSVAFCDHHVIDSQSRIVPTDTDTIRKRWGRDRLRPGLIRPFVEVALIDQAVPMAMGAVFRRELIEEFRTESGPSYDFFLTYLACRDGQAAWYTNERLSSWRVHPNQETQTGELRTLPANVFCLRTLENDPRLAAFHDTFRKRRLEIQTGYGICLLRNNRVQEGRRQLWQSLRERPTARCLGGLVLSVAPGLVRRRALGL